MVSFRSSAPKTALICHHDDPLDREGLARWMASWSDLRVMIIIKEPGGRLRNRIRREVRRVGWLRFADVLAFRFFYRLFLAKKDHLYQQSKLEDLRRRFAPLPDSCRIVHTSSPNSAEVEASLIRAAPDLTVARCKTLLAPRIFTIPRVATLVMHPGICPEYRNAHGCFWALAEGDAARVGMTLLAIDEGIDTGPIYGYYSYDFDPRLESHIVIQQRVVLENLDALEDKLREIAAGTAQPLDTAHRKSAEWGQPWLSRYWRSRRTLRTSA